MRKRGEGILLLLFILYSFSTSAKLDTVFCQEESNFFFSKIKLSTEDSIYWFLLCDCNNCTGDMMTLNILKWEESKKPQVILSVSDIKSYSVTQKVNNGLFDIVIYTRAENEEGLNIVPHYDTLVFNGRVYSIRNVNNSNIVLAEFDTINFITKIEKHLSSIVELHYTYQEALKLYKSGKKKEATKILWEKVGPKPWALSQENVSIFNDLGYFLEQVGEYNKAVEVLDVVTSKFPDRIVAWLNLGDAQKGLMNNELARLSYLRYVE
ncbi:MAG: tetratricopeptide repeat protein, partial [Chitinispirillaceae bacterium]|nr:tetratricopeptide repeat protein [Chitinispirillaceae bacterium]